MTETEYRSLRIGSLVLVCGKIYKNCLPRKVIKKEGLYVSFQRVKPYADTKNVIYTKSHLKCCGEIV